VFHDSSKIFGLDKKKKKKARAAQRALWKSGRVPAACAGIRRRVDHLLS